MIDKMYIKQFRGIRDLSITGLKRINLIFGGNNAGKTSLLESIRLFALGTRIGPIVNLASSRSSMDFPPSSRVNIHYFASLFPYSDPREGIYVSVNINGVENYSSIIGERCLIQDPRFVFAGSRGDLHRTFEGIRATVTTQKGKKLFDIGSYDRQGIENMPSVFISTSDHLRSSVLGPLVKDQEMLRFGISVANRFDSRIINLRFDKEPSGAAYDCADLENGKSLPLDSFGEGLRKCLYILGAIAKAKGGVLLIDEFDDAIHPASYGSFLSSIVDLAEKNDVQIFATTHRNDFAQALKSSNSQAFQAITLRNNDGQIIARSLPMDVVLNRMDSFDFEVRE